MRYSPFDNTKSYDPGDIVTYWGSYWRAVRPVEPPFITWLQSGEVPGESDSWVPAFASTVAAGDAYLEQVWHATARAPRDSFYSKGLDVLGATSAAPAQNVAEATAAVRSAGKRVVTVANKLASHLPKLAGRLLTLGNRIIQKSGATATLAKKVVQKQAQLVTPPITMVMPTTTKVAVPFERLPTVTTAAPAAPPAAPTPVMVKTGLPITPIAPTPTMTRQATTAAPRTLSSTGTRTQTRSTMMIRGDFDPSLPTGTFQMVDPSVIRAWVNLAAASAALADIGKLADNIYTLVQKLDTAGQTALADQGQYLINRIQNVADNFNPDDSSSGTSTVAALGAIQSDAATWQNNAQAALSGTPSATAAAATPSAPESFDPGSAGGGGGGGGGAEDSSSPESAPSTDDTEDLVPEDDAAQRFRESGGTWDPFEDDSGDAGTQEAYAEGQDEPEQDLPTISPDEDAEAQEVASDMSAAVEAFRESGEDPFADENVIGLDQSDYHFEWTDILMPHQGLQRTMEEREAKDRAVVAEFTASTTPGGPGKPSPAIAKKLAEAKRKLQILQQQEAAMKAARTAALLSANADTSQSEGDSVMGADLDLIVGAVAEVVDAGFPMEEAADIILEQYQHQITDAEPDPERAHGSTHRGAAYLNHDTGYPPHGASQGMEGGWFRPEETLEIFGKGDHMSKKDINIFGADRDISILGCHKKGVDVLGATAPAATLRKPATLSGKLAAAKASAVPRAGFVMKKTPAGNKVTSLVLNTPKKGDHKSSIKNAKDAGKRAVSVGKKLQAALTKGAAKTAVHGAPVRTAYTAKSKLKPGHKPMSPAQIKKVADQAVKVGTATIKAADTHSQYISSLSDKVKAGVALARKKYGPSGVKGTQIKGDADLEVLGNILGAYCDVLGDDAVDAADSDLSSAAVADASDLGTPPTSAPPLVAGQDYFPDPHPAGDDDTVYSFAGDLPAGAIVYDPNEKPLPWQGVGSVTRFFPSADKSDGHDNSGFQWGGGNPSIMDGWYWWWHGATSGTEYKHEKAGNTLSSSLLPYDYAGSDSSPLREKTSVALGWGPLIGNPNGWTKNLRYDSAGDRWFWFYDQAPDFAKAPIDQARLNQAILDYKAQVATAAADAAAQAMQDQLDAKNAADLAKQQAAEDAATARQQQQEQAETEHQAQMQAVVDEQAAAAAAADDERQQAAMERQAQLEEERQARTEERQADLDARMAERQAEIDARAEEHQMDLEQKAMEAAQRLDAMSPPSDEDQEAATDANEEAPDQDEYNMDADMLGHATLRGADRLRYRADHRRG